MARCRVMRVERKCVGKGAQMYEQGDSMPKTKHTIPELCKSRLSLVARPYIGSSSPLLVES